MTILPDSRPDDAPQASIVSASPSLRTANSTTSPKRAASARLPAFAPSCSATECACSVFRPPIITSWSAAIQCGTSAAVMMPDPKVPIFMEMTLGRLRTPSGSLPTPCRVLTEI
jgi:hypothetical protein